MYISCTLPRMPFLSAEDRVLLESVAELTIANPFGPERKKLEKKALGSEHQPDADVWSLRGQPRAREQNLVRIEARLGQRLSSLLGELRRAKDPSDQELRLLEDAVLFHLFHRSSDALLALATAKEDERGLEAPEYPRFEAELTELLAPIAKRRSLRSTPPQLFAAFFQLRRAFVQIFEQLVGASRPAAELRATVWESIFTHRPWRYLESLTDRMRDFSTLIIGPTGSGKELVARAVGLSQFRPFDPSTRRFAASKHLPLNLSALSPTLIESELFGHKKGSFTGAVQDRAGWLEVAGPEGVVFLDEIGELDQALQVKILRVLQTRVFQRIGEAENRRFEGKIISATNRPLQAAIDSGAFRVDLYYRLCSDLIVTPSLAEQLADAPEELGELLRFVVGRIVGDADSPIVDRAAEEVRRVVERELGPSYAWPGNFRELEQCARSVLLHGRYTPAARLPQPTKTEAWADLPAGAARPLEEVLERYVSWVFAETGSYLETARRLGVDRRTVKAKVDRRLVATWRRGAGAGSPRRAPPKP